MDHLRLTLVIARLLNRARALGYRLEKERRAKTTNLLFCYDRTGRKGALLRRMWKEIEGL